jgi:UDPglucose 6-dehydrogenase
MRLCVVGAGYVGLVSGACFADLGHTVVCVDSDRRKIGRLMRGEVPIFEPGLEALIDANVEAERLLFSADLSASVRGADALFIAVGTPSRNIDGWPDLSSIYAVVHAAAPDLRDDAIIVMKSTVPLGTGDEVERILHEARPDSDICVVSNPEFLRAGSAVKDFQHPDRIVVGAESAGAREVLREIYAPLIARNAPILYTSRRSAELIKYSANALLATKIAFINEVAELCERAEANVLEVARGVGLDERIGGRFLDAGPGFGGSCFHKDALALARMGECHETPMRIVEAVLHSNECRKRAMVRKVAAALGRPLRGKTVAVLGLTFKANTDDMREAPSITLITALLDAGAQVRAFDPAGMDVARTVLPIEVTYASSPYEAADHADAIVLMTEWPEFRRLDLSRVARQLNAPIIVDLRNFYEPEDVLDRGMDYHGIGCAPRRRSRHAAPGGKPRKNGDGRSAGNGHRNGQGMDPQVRLAKGGVAKWTSREEPDENQRVGRALVMEIGRSSG